MKNKIFKSLSMVIAILMIFTSIPINAFALDYKTKTITFDESMFDNGSQTITIPNLQSIEGVNTNTGNVSYSVDGDDVTIDVEGGLPSRVVNNPKKYSKVGTGSLTNATDSFNSTKSYSDADGYSGTLNKNGLSKVISGSYTPSDSKVVTDVKSSQGSNTTPATVPYNQNGYSGTLSKTNTTTTQVQTGGSAGDSKTVTGQTSSYYNSGGYSGTLSSYVYSGSYTPVDSKTVTSKTGPQMSTSFSSTKSYNSGGYSGTLGKSGSYYQDGSTSDSKAVSNYSTSSTNSFSSTKSYNSDGYSGTLSKSGSSYLYSGSYTAANTKYVTAQKSASYNSGGYTGYLDSYVYSGQYIPADVKEVTATKKGNKVMSLPFSDDGYTGTIYYDYTRGSTHYYSGSVRRPSSDNRVYRYQGYVTCPESDTRVWIQDYSGTVSKSISLYSQDYSGTVTKPAVDTRVYKYKGTVNKPDTRTYRTDYTANYSGTVIKPSVDNRTWQQDYLGTVYKAGNDNYYSYTVTINYIDNTAPLITVNNPLNNDIHSAVSGYSNITLSGTVNDTVLDVLKIYYNIDNGTENLIQTITADGTNQSYNEVIDVSSLSEGNHVVKIWAVDQAEAKSTEISRTITMDKTAPILPTFTANPTTPTNSNVTVTIDYSSDANVKQYKVGPDGAWTAYTVPVVVTSNNTVYAKAKDIVGNFSENLININNIDKTAPVNPVISTDETKPTNQDITVTIDFSADSAIKQYKIGSTGIWTDYTVPFKVSSNDTIYAKAIDAVGNSTPEITKVINNIDKVAPTTPILSANPTTPTNGNVTVTITYSSDSTVKQYKVGIDGTWTAYTAPVVVTSNDTVYAKGQDVVGNWSNESNLVVSNIDRVAPIITINNYETDPTNKDIVVTASVDKGTLNQESYTFTKNSEFEFTVVDEAGNTASKIVTIDNIDKELPVINAVLNNPDELTTSKTVTITVSDNNEGFVVTLPDGTTSTGEDVINYTIDKNGIHSFKIVDIAGNEATSSIDTNGRIETGIFETTDIVYDEALENREANLNVSVESESGIEKIEISRLYTATNTVEMDKITYTDVTEANYRVKENATYRITITNGNGTVLVKEVEVKDINTTTTAPLVEIKIDGESLNKPKMKFKMMRTFSSEPQANQGTEVEIIATPVHNTSIRKIEILKGGLPVESSFYSKTLEYTTSEPGDYEVVATNNKSEKTSQEFTLEKGTVAFKTDVSVDNPKANISVNATVDGNNGVAEIKLEGNDVSEAIENENFANFEVAENGIYTVTVTDVYGEAESKEVVVEGLVKDFYITYTIDNSEIEEEGIVGITARVVGENDTLSFKDQTVEGNTLITYVTTDGVYRFTAKQGDTEVFTDVVVDSFANMPPIKILINRESFESGAVKTTIKAESLDSSNIRRIEIFKDGVSVKRNTYRDNINFEALLNGEYIVKVTNSNGDVAEKAFNVFYVETFIDDSTMNEGYISIGANVTGEIDSLNLGETTTTENTLVVPITESGIYKFKAIKGKTVVTATINIDMYKYIKDKPIVDVETTEKANGVNVKVTATPANGTSIKSISVYKDNKLITSNIYQPTLAFTTTELGTYKAVVTNNKGGVTEKLFEVTYNPVKVEASYNILGTKAVILVNASSVSDTTITKIELSNGSIIENNKKATFEVTENNEYVITVTDSEGNTKSTTVTITELNEDLYINLTLDDSLLSTEGYITINANVVGEFDTFMFGEEVLTENPASINVTEDGNYVFTATIGEETISADITVDSFKKFDTKPIVDVTVDDMTISVTARPAYSTSIRSITIFKDEIRVNRNTYRTFLSYTAKDVGTYTIEVLNSKGEISTEEVVIQ